MTGAGQGEDFTGNTFSSVLFAFQAVIVLLYATVVDFGIDGLPLAPTEATLAASSEQSAKYFYLIEIQLMVLCGIAFLYSLMQRYAWTGVSFTYLMGVLCLQWSVLCAGFAEMWTSQSATADDEGASRRIRLTYTSFLAAHGVAATVLISLGAIIGRISPTQMVLMVIFEVPAAVAYIAVLGKLKATDPGGAMSIHAFGAAFGLALAAVIGDAPTAAAAEEAKRAAPSRRGAPRDAARKPQPIETGVRSSHERGTVAMVGTIMLFSLWPSFNAGPLSGHAAARMALNTLLSLSGSVATAFATSRALRGGTRFDMEHVANSTLAGGAVMGAAGDMILNPGHALLWGCLAGVVSAVSFTHGQPRLRAAGVFDACGIFSLHLLTGCLGGIASAVAAARIGPSTGWIAESVIKEEFPGRAAGLTAVAVGVRQMAATVIAVFMAAAAGAGTGAFFRTGASDPMQPSQFYNDFQLWLLEEEQTGVFVVHDESSAGRDEEGANMKNQGGEEEYYRRRGGGAGGGVVITANAADAAAAAAAPALVLAMAETEMQPLVAF